MSHSAPKAVLAAVTASLAWVATPSTADACGCFSPPIPMPGAVDFAVNQQAEQIIFEVEPDGEHIVAHVLIRYAGDPTQFAWLVPVPSVPELELSFAETFGLIDAQTAPNVSVSTDNICPRSLYYCNQHPMPSCPGVDGLDNPGGGAGMFASAPGGTGGAGGAAGTSGGLLDPPPVTVFSREQIGAYDTIVFGAGDAQAAVDWLQAEGFIVNDTTSPYMEPYLAENMLFVAAKLVPGSDADEIRPLRMRYEGNEPMIPLQLTAVATEPNLTVTAYIYGSTSFAPQDQTLLTSADIPSDAMAAVTDGLQFRNNYPMVLSRLFDEEGGRAFMLEYSSWPPRFQPTPIPGGFGPAPDCCAAADMGIDTCGIINDGECQCPLSASEEMDCSSTPQLIGAVRLVEELASKYTHMTRITTRMSAEEMTFDPMFEVDATVPYTGRLELLANMSSLSGCEDTVIEKEEFAALQAVQACATVYCGRGRCAATALGVGCACDAGYVARTYTDLDGAPSVTCVRDEAPVDLAAGGVIIPDICGTLATEDSGACVNLAGFAGMRCAQDEAAVLNGSGISPSCRAITHDSGQSGARDFSESFEDVRICAPAPPRCDARFGWLEETNATQRASVETCASSIADPSWLVVPPKPTCEMIEDILDDNPIGIGGSGGTAGTGGSVFVPSDTNQMRPNLGKSRSNGGCNVSSRSLSGLLAPGLLALLWLARRRRRNARGAQEIS
jgi:hypothetical protein